MAKKRLIPIAVICITLSYLVGSSCTNSNVETGIITIAASDSWPKVGANVACDGRDDQVQIQVAIDTGKKVVLREGNFYTSSEILLSSNSTIEGKGIGATKIIGSGKGTQYRVIRNDNTTDGNTNIVIRNMTIDGGWSYPSQAGGNGGALTLAKCQDVIVENVEVSHGSGDCIGGAEAPLVVGFNGCSGGLAIEGKGNILIGGEAVAGDGYLRAWNCCCRAYPDAGLYFEREGECRASLFIEPLIVEAERRELPGRRPVADVLA